MLKKYIKKCYLMIIKIYFSGSSACFMRTSRVQASGVGTEPLQYVM